MTAQPARRAARCGAPAVGIRPVSPAITRVILSRYILFLALPLFVQQTPAHGEFVDYSRDGQLRFLFDGGVANLFMPFMQGGIAYGFSGSAELVGQVTYLLVPPEAVRTAAGDVTDHRSAWGDKYRVGGKLGARMLAGAERRANLAVGFHLAAGRYVFTQYEWRGGAWELGKGGEFEWGGGIDVAVFWNATPVWSLSAATGIELLAPELSITMPLLVGLQARVW